MNRSGMIPFYSHSAFTIYQKSIWQIREFGEYVDPVTSFTSPGFGRSSTKEIRGTIFVLTNPRARLIQSKVRPLNYGFCFGSFLYFLGASDRVEPMHYYNPLAQKYSDDGVTLHGSAYGNRVESQINYICDLLTRDPGTRRAVVTIFTSYRDHIESKDLPCPVLLQFFVRANKLEMIAYLRSQDVLMVFPYDIFLLTMIHEWVASRTRFELGQYSQVTGSSHYYTGKTEYFESGDQMVHQVINDFGKVVRMRPMAPLEWAEISRLLFLESRIRIAANRGERRISSEIAEERWTLPEYWRWVIDLLIEFAEAKKLGHEQLRESQVINDPACGFCER